jgi:YD repeat-containing protein
MKKPALGYLFVLLAVLLCLPAVAVRSERQPNQFANRRESSGLERLWQGARPLMVAAYHGGDDAYVVKPRASDQTGGLKEVIADKYKPRWEQWKKEFLSTEVGRQQWALYEHNPDFTLTISISAENHEGAGTSKYKWDESGKLIAATITLGDRLSEGYPNPIYFPVMNSLTPHGTSDSISQNTLAATKLAHEIGHVISTARTDATLYQLQNRLIPSYNKILLSNGRNPNDPQLLDLARQMAGTPVQIWQDREYRSEANAMLFIHDRFSDEGLRCVFFHRIKQSVDTYAKDYLERFLAVAQSSPEPNGCW